MQRFRSASNELGFSVHDQENWSKKGRPMSPFAKDLPRVVIDRVSPVLDGGRYPIKRIVGSLVEVSANVFKDGHDLISARIAYRHLPRSPSQQEPEWRFAPLTYSFDPDRWFGSFRVDRMGRERARGRDPHLREGLPVRLARRAGRRAARAS